MTIQEAVEKAIKGGYKRNPMPTLMTRVDGQMHTEYNIEPLILDPKFWQALGKEMGWHEWGINGNETHVKTCESCGKATAITVQRESTSEWQYHWHQMVDHLALGRNIESYFEKL